MILINGMQIASILKGKVWDFSTIQLWDLKKDIAPIADRPKPVIADCSGAYISSLNISYINVSRAPRREGDIQSRLDPRPFNVLYDRGQGALPHLLNPQLDRDKRITAFCYQNQGALIVAYGPSIEILVQDANTAIPPSPRLAIAANEKYEIDSSLFRHVFKTNKTLVGNTEDITSLIMLPGERLVSAGQKYIHVWDITGSKLIKKFSFPQAILGIGLLSDKRLAISQKGEGIILLDLESGKATSLLNNLTAYNFRVLPGDQLAYTKDTGELVLYPLDRQKPVSPGKEHVILTTDLEKKHRISWRLKVRQLELQDILSLLKELRKSGVKKINLQNMMLKDADIPELLACLKSSTLMELDIRNTALTFGGIKALYLGLDSHPTLKKFLHSSLSAAEKCNLGECYERGKGVSADINKAFAWYYSAALAGNAYAQYRLGAYYADNSNPFYNEKKAIKWYLMAAQNNPIDALYCFAKCYSKSSEIEKNLKMAFNYHYREAIKKYPLTAYRMGQGFESAGQSYSLARRPLQQDSPTLSLKQSRAMIVAQQRGSIFPVISHQEAWRLKKLLKADIMTSKNIEPYVKVLHAVCLNVEKINQIVDIDPVAEKEQEIIDKSAPTLREYQKYLETELSRFITAYWIASTGVLELSENKKGDLLNGVSHVLGALPGFGVLLQLIPMALQELNHINRDYQINHLVKLFTNIDDIARTCRQFARKCTLVKKDEILKLAAPIKEQGLADGFLKAGKEFLHELRTNLKKLNSRGLNLTPAQELGLLHGATLIEKIMSGANEVESVANNPLPTNFLKLMGHEPPITILTALPPTEASISIEVISPSPRDTALTVEPAGNLVESVRNLTEKQRQMEETLKRLQEPEPNAIGDETQQVYALATPPKSATVTHRDRFFHQENELRRQERLMLREEQFYRQFVALQERVELLEKQNAQLQAQNAVPKTSCVIL